jgi:GNAT superfamily N-acetyltransferase
MAQQSVLYSSTDISGIGLIQPLWDQLNRHHLKNARTFRNVYSGWTFDDRREYFSRVAATGQLRIDLAIDPVSGRHIGYCVSSLSHELNGEIESVFVEESYRKQNIGSDLVSRSLAWLREGGAQRVRVSVADGNEDAFPFYQRFGFYPRMTVLEQLQN